MTQEEKALAYDEALRIARDYYEDKNCFEYLKGVLEHIFHTLKEPDDEEIRKTLFETFSNFNAAGTFWTDILRISKDKVLAWLEKQGNKPQVDSFDTELKESDDELIWLTKFIEEEAYYLSIDIRDDEDRIKLKNLQESLAWLKRQGKQEQVSEFKADDWYVSKVDGKIHNVYHFDKAEPKSAAWTEEDEKIMKGAVSFLIEFRNKGYENAVACIDWLKSIKQRMEEQ